MSTLVGQTVGVFVAALCVYSVYSLRRSDFERANPNASRNLYRLTSSIGGLVVSMHWIWPSWRSDGEFAVTTLGTVVMIVGIVGETRALRRLARRSSPER